MAITINNTGKHLMLDALDTVLNTATLTIRSGAAPGAGNTATGTVLATITTPADAMAAASSGTKQKLGTWEDASADATGNAGHFRIVAGSTVIEGTCGGPGSGADMEISNVALQSGNPFTILTFTLSMAAN
ncbi:hypothetical protein [Gemmatimonas sp.]